MKNGKMNGGTAEEQERLRAASAAAAEKEERLGDEEHDPMAPPTPPDGGYGWVIMCASFMCNVIVDGVCFSYGIFNLEFLDYYRQSKAKTSWVGSVLNGMYLSMGPIVGALANKFGCRKVTMVGSVLACAGFFLSVFSPNVDVLIFLYGGLGGAGFGLMYLPSIVMVGFYFEKRRALATGVAVCGSGIGAFVFAPLVEKLLQVYGWKGATWIVAGIVLNGVVMGALFRPLTNPKPPRKTMMQRMCDDKEAIRRECQMENEKETTTTAQHPDAPGGNKANGVSNGGPSHPHDSVLNRFKTDNKITTSQCNPKALQSLQNLGPGQLECHEPNGKCAALCKSVDAAMLHQIEVDEEALRQRVRDLHRPLYRKDIFYAGSVHHLPEFQSSNQDVNAYVKSVTSIPQDTTDGKKGTLGNCFKQCKAMTDTLREMMDFSLLKDPVFMVYGLSCFLCMTGFFVPFIYLPDFAEIQNISRRDAAFLISIIGIANTVARVGCGWISDQSWCDCLLFNNIALLVGGIATMLVPLFTTYTLLAIYSFVFGAAIAVFVSLRSIIMVELMGLRRLTNAFGLVTFCQGLSAFIGAPIAGALFDATGDYKISFFVAGGTLAMAGIICFPLRRIAAWQKKKQMAKTGNTLNNVDSVYEITVQAPADKTC